MERRGKHYQTNIAHTVLLRNELEFPEKYYWCISDVGAPIIGMHRSGKFYFFPSVTGDNLDCYDAFSHNFHENIRILKPVNNL